MYERSIKSAVCALVCVTGCGGVVDEEYATVGEDSVLTEERTAEASEAVTYPSYITGDNDWSGSTTKFGGNYWTGSWALKFGSTAAYWNGDLRTTNSKTAKYGWWWSAAASNGIAMYASFVVFVPYSLYANDWVTYTMICDGYPGKKVQVNQKSYGGQWVDLGYTSVKPGGHCGLEVQKASNATDASDIAADGAGLSYWEFQAGP